jgi:hypothetical protein
MSRWPVLIALSFGFSAAALGCAPTVQPGLANAPRLGGTGLADERTHDVVSNGQDGCSGHGEHGPLRGRVPPCPAVAHPVASTMLLPAKGSNDPSMVEPWLEHFYVGWPCPRPARPRDARVSSGLASTVCATP